MLFAALTVVITAAPIQIAAPDLSAIDIAHDRVAFYTEYLAQELTVAGFQVTTSKQIAAVVGMERQRELLGCTSESTSCMAELASALGADAVLTGTIAKIGSSYQLNLNIISAKDASTLALYRARASKEEDLLDELSKAAQKMGHEVSGKLHRDLTAPTPPVAEVKPPPAQNADPTAKPQVAKPMPVAKADVKSAPTAVTVVAAEPASSGGARRKAWIPAVAGVVLAGTGGALWAMSNAQKDELLAKNTTPLTAEQAKAIRDQAMTLRGAAIGSLVSGGVGLLTAGAMFAFGGGSSAVHAGVSADAHGVEFACGGTF